MHVEIVSDFEEFRNLEREWDGLLKESYLNDFALKHAWLCVWWEAFGAGSELRVILVRKENKLIAAAPLRLSKSRFRGLPVRELAFLSNSHVPQIDFMAAGSHLETGLRSLLEAVSGLSGWDVFRLENIPVTSPLWPVWDKFFSSLRFATNRKIGLMSPYLVIDQEWNEYFPALSKKFRKVLRNKINRLQKNGEVELVEIRSDFDEEQVFADMFRISANSWKAEDGLDLASDPVLRKFFHDITLLAAKKGWLRLWFLKLDGVAIAFEYHLVFNQVSSALRADFDEEFRALQPGSYLDAKIVERLFESDVVRYDMGGTNDFYKCNWSDTTHSHWHAFLFSPTAYASLLNYLEFRLIPRLRRNPFLRKITDRYAGRA